MVDDMHNDTLQLIDLLKNLIPLAVVWVSGFLLGVFYHEFGERDDNLKIVDIEVFKDVPEEEDQHDLPS
jgi:hypothetical protein